MTDEEINAMVATIASALDIIRGAIPEGLEPNIVIRCPSSPRGHMMMGLSSPENIAQACADVITSRTVQHGTANSEVGIKALNQPHERTLQ